MKWFKSSQSSEKDYQETKKIVSLLKEHGAVLRRYPGHHESSLSPSYAGISLPQKKRPADHTPTIHQLQKIHVKASF